MWDIVVKALLGLVGLFLNHKTSVAENTGKTEQKLEDQTEAYNDLAKAADAARNADADRVRNDPKSAEIDPNPAKDYPDIEFRD